MDAEPKGSRQCQMMESGLEISPMNAIDVQRLS